MKILRAFAMAALVTTGCGDQDQISEYSKAGPLFLGFPGEYGACPSEPVENVGPEEWERPVFLKRIKDEKATIPVNITCVIENFSDEDLLKYRNEGDPVAQLAYIYKIYDGNGALACHDIAEIRKELSSSYRYPSGLEHGPISRVPEAAYIMSLFQSYCEPGSEEFNALNLSAYDLGYDAAANRGHLVE